MTSAGAGGFAKGFANGFVTTFNAGLQRQHETDQLTLKSRLDQLKEDADARKKKQEEEQTYLTDGKTLAEMMGDPSLAPEVANLRRTMSSDSILDAYRRGNLSIKPAQAQKKVEVPNSDLKPNTVKMPEGVATEDMATKYPNVFERTPEMQAIVDGANTTAAPANTPANWTKEAEIRGISPDEAQDALIRADKTIKDAGINFGTDDNDKLQKAVAQNTNGRITFTPDKKELEIGSLVEEMYKYEQAKETGNTAVMLDQERKIELIKKAEFIKAKQKADLEGVPLTNYAIVDKNNKLISLVPGERDENGNIVNASTDNNERKNPVTIDKAAGQRLVQVSDEQVKQNWQIQEKFATQSKDYKTSALATAEAVSYTRKMDEILARNPSVTTSTQGIMVFGQGLMEEAKALQRVFDNSVNEANSALSTNENPGDPYALSASVAKMEQGLKDLELQKLSLSDKNAQDALDKTLYDNYQTLAAYKLAMANGQSGQAAGEKDIQRHLKMVGQGVKNAASVRQILANQLKEQIAKNDNMRDSLNRDVAEWGPSLGFVPNVTAAELGSMIKDKADREYFINILKMKEDAQLQTRTAADEADAVANPVAPVENNDIPIMKSPADAYKLPSGTKFRVQMPDGTFKEKIRP